MHETRVESYPMWQVRRQASRLDGQPKLDKRGRVHGWELVVFSVPTATAGLSTFVSHLNPFHLRRQICMFSVRET